MTENMNLGQDLESITNKVDETLANDSVSVDTLTSLQSELFGYKPLGRFRQIRAQLYAQIAVAPARSDEKKAIKTQIINLRTLEDTLATRVDEALDQAKVRARAAKEARQAEEHSPISE